MGLPDPNSAKEWGGKLLVDRDGAEIGTCTEIFVDDATGLPEWAAADVSGGPAFIPLMDAAEAGDRVKVAVLQADVAGAPPVGDMGHISEDEEERLYQHYGIAYSRADSESLLPVDEPVAPAEPALPLSLAPDAPEATDAAEATDAVEVTDAPEAKRALLPTLSAGIVGALAVVAAAVFWWRRRQQIPPTRQELLAARARAASVLLATRRAQLATSAAPLLQSARRLSATARQQAAVQARVASDRAAVQARTAADRAAVQARTAADRAAVQARAAAEQAAALAATARTLRLQRVPQAADLEPEPVPTSRTGGRQKLIAVLQTAAGFAAGYAVRARADSAGFEQLKQAPAAWAQHPQVQQTAGRVRSGVSGALQTSNGLLSRASTGVTQKVRRRSDGSGPDDAGAGPA